MDSASSSDSYSTLPSQRSSIAIDTIGGGDGEEEEEDDRQPVAQAAYSSAGSRRGGEAAAKNANGKITLSSPLMSNGQAKHDQTDEENSEIGITSLSDADAESETEAADAAKRFLCCSSSKGSFIRSESFLLGLSSFALLVCWLINNILWVYCSYYFGVLYAFYLDQSTTVMYLLFLTPMVAWKRWGPGGHVARMSAEAAQLANARDAMVRSDSSAAAAVMAVGGDASAAMVAAEDASGSSIPIILAPMPARRYFVMGLLDAVYDLLTTLASPRTSGPVQNLLFQLPVPLAMVLVRLWPAGGSDGQKMHTGFKKGEYLGAAIIVGGAIVSIWPQLVANPDDGSDGSDDSTGDDSTPTPSNSPSSILIYTIGVVFYTISSVYKESSLKSAPEHTDVWTVSFIENSWALMIGFLLTPVLWIPGIGEDIPSTTWPHFKAGAGCMFKGESTLDPTAQCENILWLCALWITSNIGVNVLGLVVVRRGDSVVYNLVNSVQLPLSNLLFTSSFIMTTALASPIDGAMWGGLAIVAVGVAIYHFLPLFQPRKSSLKIAVEAAGIESRKEELIEVAKPKDRENGIEVDANEAESYLSIADE